LSVHAISGETGRCAVECGEECTAEVVCPEEEDGFVGECVGGQETAEISDDGLEEGGVFDLGNIRIGPWA